MRIITGSAKGKQLKTLEGEETRPTAERVKEAIFSALQFELEGRTVLDLFAGSGQLGLEAMSRGASSVRFVDASRDAMAIVKENAEKTGFFDDCRYSVTDYRNFLRKSEEKFDIVFIDPPYAMAVAADACMRVLDCELAKPTTLFVLESGEEDVFAKHPALLKRVSVRKKQKYGRTYIHILEVCRDA